MTLPRLNVLAIGGTHQFAHFLPVACALHSRGRCAVTIFVPTDQDRLAVCRLTASLGLPQPPIVEMTLPNAVGTILPRGLHKVARLMQWARVLRACDAILCAERTSTLLRRLPGRCPPLFHIPHGAGDRAVGFEKRFALFDQVLVAGPKDRDRLVEDGVVNADRCVVTGPIKLATMLRTGGERTPLFDNDRPVLLYNPHFDRTLGSFERFGRRLIDFVRDDGRYNLVVAPHLRMGQDRGSDWCRLWESLSIPGRIIVDTGSGRLTDMSYTLGCDLYIGDVSSQIYEFLIRPRPCLFVNSHDAHWEASPDYAMWHLGEVVGPNCDIGAAIQQSFRSHASYRERQERRIRYAFGDIGWTNSGAPRFGIDPIMKAASCIETMMTKDDAHSGQTAGWPPPFATPPLGALLASGGTAGKAA